MSGDVDLATAPTLGDTVDAVIAGRPAAFIIDLSAVLFLGSAGLQILALVPERLGPSVPYAVVADGPETSRPIRLTMLDEVFSIYPTLQDAVVGLGLVERSPSPDATS